MSSEWEQPKKGKKKKMKTKKPSIEQSVSTNLSADAESTDTRMPANSRTVNQPKWGDYSDSEEDEEPTDVEKQADAEELASAMKLLKFEELIRAQKRLQKKLVEAEQKVENLKNLEKEMKKRVQEERSQLEEKFPLLFKSSSSSQDGNANHSSGTYADKTRNQGSSNATTRPSAVVRPSGSSGGTPVQSGIRMSPSWNPGWFFPDENPRPCEKMCQYDECYNCDNGVCPHNHKGKEKCPDGLYCKKFECSFNHPRGRVKFVLYGDTKP